MDLPSSPSKAVKRGKPTKKKAKAAMVDLASSPSKQDKRGRPANNEEEAAAAMVDLASSPSKLAKRGKPAKNEGEVAMVDLANSPSKGAMVDLVSSPSKGATFVRYTRGKTRAQMNVMIVPPESEPVKNEIPVLFNDKIFKKCKFTLCWVHALTFIFCLKITKYLILHNLLSVLAHIFNYCCTNSMFSAVSGCSFSVPANSL